MALEIITPGLSTTVQDRGRSGYYNVGIPQCGSMDRYSSEIANALVGNDSGPGTGAAVLECSYVGPTFRVDAVTSIAVAGAPVEVKVNGEPRPQWARLELKPGDEVSFGVIKGGTKFCVAVRGGIDVPMVLGSRSTYVLGAFGGFQGRKLAAGDVLPIGVANGPLPHAAQLPENHIPRFTGPRELRVIMGLYAHRLTERGRALFLESEWTLTPVADRMGLRYDGPGVEWVERKQPFGAGSDPSNIVDAGYAVGSIQIPGGTQPIVLHRDAVSGGGYAMVGTVISADMDLLARSAPGTKTRFTEVTMDTALEARRTEARRLREAIASLG
ncbi:biotin-dependent carboxyltransferase family protein [Sinomonas sp. ASV322]|uniref:5-oxoprolinase subunit C family protein n=1 Tax=Sinomonas sp. ASV322 TaxID=3041920 RepID=UPI0027DC8E86|nr:biotin-dependent carboxyltransferase family protein [Sinomonas sp. ASV322]MDQ4504232.1 biotin-dependent carboxyltransferase family protein [Sinomonas sp. ASV322]